MPFVRKEVPIPIDTTDGIPQKWLWIISGNPPKWLSPQDVEEILGIATMLENKGKFQKAANLLYGCIVADYHNEELRKRWDDLIQKANRQEAELQKRMRDDEVLAEKRAQQRADAQTAAVLSDTQRWNNLRAANKLPEKDPNWHIGRLKPWMVEDAMNLGLQYKEAGMTHRDPFQRVQQLEEACKMFNKVLELKPHDETARRHMGECCTAMNSDYQRMKGIKKMDKALNPDAPFTSIGDWAQSQAHGKPTWVARAREPGGSQRTPQQPRR